MTENTTAKTIDTSDPRALLATLDHAERSCKTVRIMGFAPRVTVIHGVALDQHVFEQLHDATRAAVAALDALGVAA